jgi:hypothetical protein
MSGLNKKPSSLTKPPKSGQSNRNKTNFAEISKSVQNGLGFSAVEIASMNIQIGQLVANPLFIEKFKNNLKHE